MLQTVAGQKHADRFALVTGNSVVALVVAASFELWRGDADDFKLLLVSPRAEAFVACVSKLLLLHAGDVESPVKSAVIRLVVLATLMLAQSSDASGDDQEVQRKVLASGLLGVVSNQLANYAIMGEGAERRNSDGSITTVVEEVAQFVTFVSLAFCSNSTKG